jgi:hypothetical protein
MYGIALAYTYHRDLMAKLEFRYAMGQVDYDNVYGLTIDDIDDQEWEIRGLIGYDFRTSPNFFITPYFGVGYRYLKSDPDNPFIGTTSTRLYERESNYFYSPIGINFTSLTEGGWMFVANGEVDFLWYGLQKSNLSRTFPYDDAENEQDSGSGYCLRASLRIQKRFESVSLAIEPFVRYWHIKESDWEQVTSGGVPVTNPSGDLLYVFEPKNTTTELGCLLTVQF